MVKEVKGKRAFKKLVTVTKFEIAQITEDGEIHSFLDENGEQVQFKRRASAESYCRKHGLCYVELKYIFYR